MGNVMTKDSCISFPPKDKLIIIRQSLVEICVNATAYKSADPQCAAAILQYFIYRTDGKLDQISEYKTEVEIARKSKQDAPPIPELWIFKTQDELYQDDLLAHFGRNTVVYSLRWLVEVSPYLSERNNPKYSWDKTKQYRVNVEAIQSAIESLPVNTASFTDKLSNTSQVNNGKFEDKPAIPEYTTKKEQSKKDSAAAGASGDVPQNSDDNSSVKEKKPLTEYQQFTQKLADICGEDMEIKSIAKKVGVNAAELWKKGSGYKIPDLERFEKWWYVNDWRGKKRQKPNLTNVKSLIKQATQVAKIEPVPDKPAQSTFPPGLKPYHLMERDKQHG